MENKVLLNQKELAEIAGGNPGPAPSPEPSPAPVPSGSVVGRAQGELGKPYSWGGVGPESYDASGLVSYCLAGMHVRVGTTSTFLGWPRVADPRPGDICVSQSHCGIYVGNCQMIHAPTFGAVVSYGAVQSGMVFVRYPG